MHHNVEAVQRIQDTQSPVSLWVACGFQRTPFKHEDVNAVASRYFYWSDLLKKMVWGMREFYPVKNLAYRVR